MSNDNNTISMSLRQALIQALPLFSSFPQSFISELTNLFSEIHLEPNEKIVIENEPVDSIFIIATGRAEVWMRNQPIAVLFPGESIGLSETGFYSQSGKRTATVIAATKMILLKLNLQNFFQFFQKYPNLQQDIQAAADKMLRFLLIKKSLPFSPISHERLEWLMKEIKIQNFSANEYIFKQGDEGKFCYLISKGRVEIIAEQKMGNGHVLATLKSPALFGEATLITREPRNASARAIENCELLVISKAKLMELFEAEENVAKMFMTLMIERSRPKKNPDITEHPQKTEDDQEIVILKHPKGTYFKLSQEGFFIWKQLNGKRTLQEITLSLAKKRNVFAPDIVAALISKLAQDDFLTNLKGGFTQEKNPSFFANLILKIRKLLEFKIVFGDVDALLTGLYQKGIHFFFSKIGKIILFLIAVFGFIVFVVSIPHIIHLYKTMHNSWMLLVLLIPFSIISILLHELGHAFMTKSFGHEVHYMGIGWYWFAPVAFADTSDMWLSSRGPKIWVNLAGIIMDVILGGVCSLLIFVLSDGYIEAFLWVFALFCYINAFRMISPLQEWDGYYILMDLLNAPKLRQSAVLWLMKDFSQVFTKPKVLFKKPKEIIYWLTCIFYLILLILLTVLVQKFLFQVFHIQSASLLGHLILPTLAVLASTLSVVADIKSQAIDKE